FYNGSSRNIPARQPLWQYSFHRNLKIDFRGESMAGNCKNSEKEYNQKKNTEFKTGGHIDGTDLQPLPAAYGVCTGRRASRF
ncbi:MAG: hypothetical protein K2P30_15150, partial [Lachnospiraceae bacterium]|nr:hypothetical protein [Lachnospiraceae bacterium]